MRKTYPSLASFAAYLAGFVCLLLASAASAQTANPQDLLMQKAQDMQMTKLEYLDGGVYGKHGNHVMYFVHKTQLKDLNGFYATMVRVLSTKYGCFMKARTKDDRSYNFRCKDGRNIIIRHGQSGNIYYFAGRQFDRSGDEIVINSLGTTLATLD